MTDGEIAVAVEATHVIGRRVAAPARASESVKRAVRHGVDVIYHCDFADEEALDLLEAAKHRVFTGPAFGIVLARMEGLRGDNSRQGRVVFDRLQRLYEASCRTHNAMRKRGIRSPRPARYGCRACPWRCGCRSPLRKAAAGGRIRRHLGVSCRRAGHPSGRARCRWLAV